MRTPPPHRFRSFSLTLIVLVAVLALLSGCNSPEQLARQAFGAFQHALFTGDQEALRPLLSSSSQLVPASLLVERARGKQQLVVKDVIACSPQYEIAVTDPNDGDRRSTFIVVREGGRYVVDLVRTTACNHVTVANPNGKRTIQPRALTPDDIAKIRSLPASALR